MILVFRPLRLATDIFSPMGGLAAVAEIWRRLKQATFDPYRPELHYMRGPGPKWHEKHATLVRSEVRSATVNRQQI
jgi:hypothetical protein